MGIKHLNKGNDLGQNCQIKICSFQLMEGNPSFSCQYLQRLKASIYWHLATTDLDFGLELGFVNSLLDLPSLITQSVFSAD